MRPHMHTSYSFTCICTRSPSHVHIPHTYIHAHAYTCACTHSGASRESGPAHSKSVFSLLSKPTSSSVKSTRGWDRSLHRTVCGELAHWACHPHGPSPPSVPSSRLRRKVGLVMSTFCLLSSTCLASLRVVFHYKYPLYFDNDTKMKMMFVTIYLYVFVLPVISVDSINKISFLQAVDSEDTWF